MMDRFHIHIQFMKESVYHFKPQSTLGPPSPKGGFNRLQIKLLEDAELLSVNTLRSQRKISATSAVNGFS